MRISRTKLLAGGIAVSLALGGVAAYVVGAGRGHLEDLREATDARDEAAANIERIVRHLEAIAEDLGEAADLPQQSEEIGELTTAQRRSIQELIDLLGDQVQALARTRSAVERTRGATAAIAELSAEEAARLRTLVGRLERLRALAEEAGGTSAQLARLARYGAILSEETRDAFSRP